MHNLISPLIKPLRDDLDLPPVPSSTHGPAVVLKRSQQAIFTPLLLSLLRCFWVGSRSNVQNIGQTNLSFPGECGLYVLRGRHWCIYFAGRSHTSATDTFSHQCTSYPAHRSNAIINQEIPLPLSGLMWLLKHSLSRCHLHL